MKRNSKSVNYVLCQYIFIVQIFLCAQDFNIYCRLNVLLFAEGARIESKHKHM